MLRSDRPTRRHRSVAAASALLVLGGLLVAQPVASAALTGTATIADADRPRSATFATSLDGDFTATTRVLMRTLDAGTTTWREWGLELGQSVEYDSADVAARELLVEGTGVMSNGLGGYNYLRRSGNGVQERNERPSDVTAPAAFSGGNLQNFSTKESGGLLIELNFSEFTKSGNILQETAIADAEFRIEILSRVKDAGTRSDVDFRLATLNELTDTAISSQGLDPALAARLYRRATGITLFHCNPITDGCTAQTASSGGTYDPIIETDAATLTAAGGGTQVGVVQAYGRANTSGQAWLWLTGPTQVDFMVRIADRRTDDPTTDGFDTVGAASLDGDGDLVVATPIPDSRIIRVISEQVGYAFDGNNPSPNGVSMDSRRETAFFAKRHNDGTALLNYRGFLPDAPIDVYQRLGGGTTTSPSNCVRDDRDICVRPVPPVNPVVFNGASGDWVPYDFSNDGGNEVYSADANDAYFPFRDHGAVGIYAFVPNCDRLDLAASTLTVDQALVAYGNGGGAVAPQTTVRAQLYNSCGEPYRGPSRTFNITVPNPAGGTSTVSVTTNSRGLATTTITAPDDPGSAPETLFTDNISTDFGTGDTPSTTTVNFFGPNTPSIANSTLTMLSSSAVADGTDVTTAVVQLRNAQNAAVGEGTLVCLSFAFAPAPGVTSNAWTAPVPPGTPTPAYWTTDATGRVEVDMPSPTTGTVTVTAADDPCGTNGTVAAGAAIGDPAGVTGTYTAGDADADEADISIADARIDPNGSSTTTVTVTVRDANGNPIGAGQSVCLETVANADDTDSTGTLSSGPWTTDANGQVTAIVTSPTAAGAATIYGWLGTCGSKAGGIGAVQVTYAQGPASGSDPGGPLVCSPNPVPPGATVDCSFAGGNPDFDYLWQASFLANVFATAGMTTIADGSGGFSFVVPDEAACRDILVELVGWDISTLITVLCAPTGLPAGGGPADAPLLPLAATMLLAVGLTLGLRGRGTRPSTDTA
jgi:hypothetical protein